MYYMLQNIGGGLPSTSSTDALFASSANVLSMSSAIFVGGTSNSLGLSLKFTYGFVSTYPSSSVIQNDDRTFKLSVTINEPSFALSALNQTDGLFTMTEIDMTVVTTQLDVLSVNDSADKLLPTKIPAGVVEYILEMSYIQFTINQQGSMSERDVALRFQYT